MDIRPLSIVVLHVVRVVLVLDVPDGLGLDAMTSMERHESSEAFPGVGGGIACLPWPVAQAEQFRPAVRDSLDREHEFRNIVRQARRCPVGRDTCQDGVPFHGR